MNVLRKKKPKEFSKYLNAKKNRFQIMTYQMAISTNILNVYQKMGTQ